jgi:predicted Zn-dependent peptidase
MYDKITFNNGVRLVYEKIPCVRSVSFGLWIKAGSRSENYENNGISHFIEHMLFKGTKKRTAREIAALMDNIGGQLNAFTGKEYTCFYSKTLDEHLDIGIEILADMFMNSLFAKKDIDTEKRVILEEIAMSEDTPEDLVHEYLSSTVWPEDPLGYPVIGTTGSIKDIRKNTILEYKNIHYSPKNMVIAVAGNFNENELKEAVRKYFGDWEPDSNESIITGAAEYIGNCAIKEKDTEQVHICIGFEGIELGNEDFYTLHAINNILGGGMSSRLFQNIREEKGLVYSIYSYPSAYKNAGLVTIYAGMNPENLINVICLVKDEISLLVNSGISEDSLRNSKEQLKGSYILGLESTSSRMTSIGMSELLLGHVLSPDEVLKKINEISMEKAKSIIEKIFHTNKIGFAAIGKIKEGTDVMGILSN